MSSYYANDIILYLALITGFYSLQHYKNIDIFQSTFASMAITYIIFCAPHLKLLTRNNFTSHFDRAYIYAAALSMAGGLLGLLCYRLVYLAIGRLFDDTILGNFALVATTCDASILLISSLMIADLHKIKKGEICIRHLFTQQIIFSCTASIAIIYIGPKAISFIYRANTSDISAFILPMGLSVISIVAFKFVQNILLIKYGAMRYFFSNSIMLSVLSLALLLVHESPVQLVWSLCLAQAFVAIALILWHRDTLGLGLRNETY